MDRENSIPGTKSESKTQPRAAEVSDDSAEGHQVATPEEPLVIINASDDFKIDSLRKKGSHLLALSENRGVDSNNDVIATRDPEYMTDTQSSATNSILKSAGGERSPLAESEATSDGVENPIFQPEDEKRPRQKSEQNKFPGFRKKVSWDETVVYNSGNQTDIVIAGLHEEESGTDKEEEQSSGEGQGRWSRARSNRAAKVNDSEYRCPLCTAVVLIAVAVVGILVLGTMYGVRYSNEKTTSEIMEDIKQKFSLLPSQENSVFLYTLYRPPSDQALDGATYFLLEKESIMPWQSPEGTATFVWLQGAPVEVLVLDRRGRVSTRLLSDPLSVQGAQYTLTMTNTDWFAARLQQDNAFALLALSQDSASRNWVHANLTTLLSYVVLPELQDDIRHFAKPPV